MTYVAIIGAAASVGSAAIAADAKKSASADQAVFGGGAGGGSGGGFTSPGIATYGTNIGNDGFAINFGAGTQNATSTKKESANYPGQTSGYPFTAPPGQWADGLGDLAGDSGMSNQTLLLLAVAGVIAIRVLRK